jgi:hypothetical protein
MLSMVFVVEAQCGVDRIRLAKGRVDLVHARITVGHTVRTASDHIAVQSLLTAHITNSHVVFLLEANILKTPATNNR